MSEDKVEFSAEGNNLAVPVADAVAVATPTPATILQGTAPTTELKQGAKCCGCCCDYRRAVIIVAIVGICFNIFDIVLYIAEGTSSFMTGAVIGIFFLVFQIVAAIKYNLCMLYTSVFFQLIQFLYYVALTIYDEELDADMIAFNELNGIEVEEDEVLAYWEGPEIFGLVMNAITYALFIYPIVGMITEVKSGIMSEATYTREAHSCCCLRKV